MVVVASSEWTEMDEERLARMEVSLTNGTEDLRRTREAMEHAVEMLAERMNVVELRIRSLEDQELRQRTLSHERERVAQETAERMLDHKHRVISRTDLWLTALLLVAGSIVAALIASGHIF